MALVQFVGGLVAVASGLIELPRLYGSGATWWLVVAACVTVLLGLGAFVAQFRRLPIVAAGLALLTVLVAYPAITAGSAPRLNQLWVSPRLAELVKKDSRRGDPPPALAGYTEPSLVFYLDKDVRLTNGPGAAEIGAGQGGLALIEDSMRQPFVAHLAELEATATRVDEVSGYNYSRGRPVHITIYRVTATHDITEPPAE